MPTDGTHESDHNKRLKAALADLMLQQREALLRIIRRKTDNSWIEEDILHAAYVKIRDMIEKDRAQGIPSHPTELFRYFISVARTTTVDQIGKLKRHKAAENPAEVRGSHQLDIARGIDKMFEILSTYFGNEDHARNLPPGKEKVAVRFLHIALENSVKVLAGELNRDDLVSLTADKLKLKESTVRKYVQEVFHS